MTAQESLVACGRKNNLKEITLKVSVTLSRFYCPANLLRSYPAGQLIYPQCSWAGLYLLSGQPIPSTAIFSRNKQLSFLNQWKQRNGTRKNFAINLFENCLTGLGFEHATLELQSDVLPTELCTPRPHINEWKQLNWTCLKTRFGHEGIISDFKINFLNLGIGYRLPRPENTYGFIAEYSRYGETFYGCHTALTPANLSAKIGALNYYYHLFIYFSFVFL